MKKKLYYTIEKELNPFEDYELTTGRKTVRVYDMDENAPKLFTVLDLDNGDITEDEIQQYLEDNGHGDETFELKQL